MMLFSKRQSWSPFKKQEKSGSLRRRLHQTFFKANNKNDKVNKNDELNKEMNKDNENFAIVKDQISTQLSRTFLQLAFSVVCFWYCSRLEVFFAIYISKGVIVGDIEITVISTCNLLDISQKGLKTKAEKGERTTNLAFYCIRLNCFMLCCKVLQSSVEINK